MPGAEGKIVYPPGVRDITEEISTDDLVRRLKDCSHAFQNMSQDDDNSAYIPLALHLASEAYLEHNSSDIQLLVACCIADVFRVYAPEAPYKDLGQLKVIFEFFVEQLKGLEDPQNPSFKRYFYLLENLSCVKTFNICVELEDNQKIICRLFTIMFSIINDNHSIKVKKFMLDMLSPLISEADVVSQELLDIILNQIVEPTKSQSKNACALSQDILKRTSSTIETYIQGFFNNALILGKTSQSEMSHCLYELIYELNAICPSMLVVVLPQLEFKLKSNEEKERLEVTKVLARMFSDENSILAQQNQSLWTCFLGRFTDISIHVRTRCVQYSMQFLLNHPELREDITEQLKHRQHDPEESVRYEVVMAIISTAKKDFSSINEDLLSFVKERTLDKKFKIRKEALLGLSMLYKQHMGSSELSTSALESISWIKNKVLHVYYQTALEDKLLVERILHTCLVPYQSPLEIRMKKLYQLFASIDDYAVRAFREILKCQHSVRIQVRNIMDLIQRDKSENRFKTVASKVALLSKSLQDPVRSQDYILKFCKELESNLKLRNMLSVILNGNITCTEAEIKVKEILKTLGFPVQTNTYYMIIKQLLERIAPVLVDKEGIRYLISFVKDCLCGDGALEAEMNLCDSSNRGLELLHALCIVFPSAFHDAESFNNLLLFLQTEDDGAAELTLQILKHISVNLEIKFPEIFQKLVPLVENFIETGTKKQAKHAVYCLNVLANDKEVVFGTILERLQKHYTLESQYFRTALVSAGHIAFLCHDMFASTFKSIVAKIVVKDLLMNDKDLPRGGEDTWGPLESLPDETKAKIEGMKLMVRWLMGLKDMVTPAASTLRLLTTVILHGGDLMERQHTAPSENSWLRYTAASCILKLCQEPNYASSLALDQFQLLSSMISDSCFEVRERFAQKLHKGLLLLKLPLEFLAIFSLAGVEERKEFKQQIKNHLSSNFNKRRDYIKLHPMPNTRLLMYLPDYVLPYTIHLLAHAPFLTEYDDVPSLLKVKECLWLVMEPLIVKSENYSFSFFKRLIENIKQTKDKQDEMNESANLKLYAVCDLALGLVMSKTTNFVLKEFPTQPILPSRFFTNVDKSYSNMKTYLPPELVATLPKLQRTGFELEMFEAPGSKAKKPTPPTTSTLTTSNLTPSASERSVASMDISPLPTEQASELSAISTPASISEKASTSSGIVSKLRTRGLKKAATESPISKRSRTESPSVMHNNSPRSTPSEALEKSSEHSDSEPDLSSNESSSEVVEKKNSSAKGSYARTRNIAATKKRQTDIGGNVATKRTRTGSSSSSSVTARTQNNSISNAKTTTKTRNNSTSNATTNRTQNDSTSSATTTRTQNDSTNNVTISAKTQDDSTSNAIPTARMRNDSTSATTSRTRNDSTSATTSRTRNDSASATTSRTRNDSTSSATRTRSSLGNSNANTKTRTNSSDSAPPTTISRTATNSSVVTTKTRSHAGSSTAIMTKKQTDVTSSVVTMTKKQTETSSMATTTKQTDGAGSVAAAKKTDASSAATTRKRGGSSNSIATKQKRTSSRSKSNSQENGLSDSEILLSSNAGHLIKNCNVFLDKDEVERYSISSVTDYSPSDKTLSPCSPVILKPSKIAVQPLSPVATRDRSKVMADARKDDVAAAPTPSKRRREASSENIVKKKKPKSNSSENTSKLPVSPPKMAKQAIVATPLQTSKPTLSVNPSKRMPKQITSIDKSPLSPSVKTSKSKAPVSISSVKNSRASSQKLTKSPLVNGTRSGGNVKTAVDKISKNKPKAEKQPVLKKGKKVEDKPVTRRR